jgi:hypothetical protein
MREAAPGVYEASVKVPASAGTDRLHATAHLQIDGMQSDRSADLMLNGVAQTPTAPPTDETSDGQGGMGGAPGQEPPVVAQAPPSENTDPSSTPGYGNPPNQPGYGNQGPAGNYPPTYGNSGNYPNQGPSGNYPPTYGNTGNPPTYGDPAYGSYPQTGRRHRDQNQLFINVTSPAVGQPVNGDFAITGKTLPYAQVKVEARLSATLIPGIITIGTQRQHATGVADGNGNFMVPMHLSASGNNIVLRVVAFDPQTAQSRLVEFTVGRQGPPPPTHDAPPPTGESQ